LIFTKGIKINELPAEFVQRGSFNGETKTANPVAPQNIILHWCGNYHEFIKNQIVVLTQHSLINFF
ncbi:MAG TPA: hypothetical protein VGP47_06150, partial [Parachlamydiaceae bacterium]|nr:hypothetical protein [Parachlamydiaceae bacterium]